MLLVKYTQRTMEQAHNDCNTNVQYMDKDSCTADKSMNNNSKNTDEDDNSTTTWYVIKRRAAAITAAVIICEFYILS